MKVVTIVGARPQFIKAATVSRALRNIVGIREVLVHTGQHYDDNMSNVFFVELDIPSADYHLGVGSYSHGVQTGRMLEALEGVLVKESPDWVLVYGDTNSTLAGALTAAKLHIPVAHIEAGLRSYNRRMPEEVNRVMTDHLSTVLLAPTETAVKNLHREGISDLAVHLVGDVMYDAALYYGAKAERESSILCRLHLSPHAYILATIHRPENTDDVARLRVIAKGLNVVAARLPVICPLHPRTRKVMQKEGLLSGLSDQFHVIDPVGYLDMVMLEKHAFRIATDSGGVQKEAFFYRVPCVTLRTETEWIELVDLGWNRIVPPFNVDAIRDALIESWPDVDAARQAAESYGGGHAATRISDIIRTTESRQ